MLRLWRVRGGRLRLVSEKTLWRRWAHSSCVSREAQLPLPRSLLTARLQDLRIWFAQPVLSRGLARPTSRAFSAREACCSIRTITRYRQHGIAEGWLVQLAQYERLRPLRWGNLAELSGPRSRSEFAKGGWVWRRLPDLVVVLDTDGEARNTQTELPPTLRRRVRARYFPDRDAIAAHHSLVARNAVFFGGGATWNPATLHSFSEVAALDAALAEVAGEALSSIGISAYNEPGASRGSTLPSELPVSRVPNSPSGRKLSAAAPETPFTERPAGPILHLTAAGAQGSEF